MEKILTGWRYATISRALSEDETAIREAVVKQYDKLERELYDSLYKAPPLPPDGRRMEFRLIKGGKK